MDESKRVCYISNPFLLQEIDVHTPAWWERCGGEVRKYNATLAATDPSQNPVVVRYVEPSPVVFWTCLIVVIFLVYKFFKTFVTKRDAPPAYTSNTSNVHVVR